MSCAIDNIKSEWLDCLIEMFLIWLIALVWGRCSTTEVVFHDVGVLSQKLFPIVEAMQKHFSAGSGAYYSDAIFFLSVAMHHIMPTGKSYFSYKAKSEWCSTTQLIPSEEDVLVVNLKKKKKKKFLTITV